MNVSIVTYHTDLDEMRACLASLATPVVGKIFVIDNSADPAMQRFCEDYEQITYIESDNVGYGAAHNKALRISLAEGESYHLVLNSDVRFDPAVLASLQSHIARRPDIGILQPAVVYPDGTPQATARLLPTPLDVFGRRFLPKFLMRGRNARYTLQSAMTRGGDINVPYLQGSFMLINLAALEAKGLFDERFFMYPEDIDLCRRMYPEFRVVSHRDLTIVHDHRAASYHNTRLLRIHIINMIRYFNKWGWFVDATRRRINRLYHTL